MIEIIINANDSDQRGLIPSFFLDSTGPIQEFFNRDKTIKAMVRVVEPSGDASFPWADDYVDTDEIYLQIGNVDGRPTDGTFTLTFGASTTAALPHNVTTTALKTALEAAGTGTVTVSLLTAGVYQVDWVSVGVIANPITGSAALLIPSCGVEVTVMNIGSATEREQRVIELRQSAVCDAIFSTPFVPVAPSVSQKAANSGAQNAIYEINLGDAYQGEYTVSITANGVSNIVVLSAEMESEAIGTALAAHAEIEFQSIEFADNIAVSKNGKLVTVQFVGALGGVESVRTISGSTVANPSVVTSAVHKLKTGDSVVISGSDSTPTLDGTHTVTVITPNTFSVPVNVTAAGTVGSFYATTQPSIAYGSDLSLKFPKGFVGEINLNAIPLTKAFWGTDADTLSFPIHVKRLRASEEERTLFGDTVTLKRHLVNISSSVPIILRGSVVIASGKTVTFNNTLTFAGTDGSLLNIGAGGTLGALALLSAVNLATNVTGTLPHGNLGTGGGGATKFLREDSTWQAIAVGGDTVEIGTDNQAGTLVIWQGDTVGNYVAISAGGTLNASRAWTFPDADGLFVGADTVQTLTNKTISGTNNSFSGIPVNSLAQSTTDAIGVGSVNLGHASDTTLARVSAGVLSVEGNTVAMLGTAQTFTGIQTVSISGSSTSVPGKYYVPALTPGNGAYVNVGRDESPYNLASFGFNYVGSGSASNELTFSLYGQPISMRVRAASVAIDVALNLTKEMVLTSQALSGAGAINLTTTATDYTSTGVAQALTLANGTAGQIKTITHIVDGGGGILTPTTKSGYTTITFNNAGDSVTLRYCTTAGWCVIGSFGAVIA